MDDDENGKNDKFLQDMAETDMMAELMGLISQQGVSNKKLCKIFAYVERVLSEAD